MTLDSAQTVNLLLAISALLAAAHLGGYLAVRLHQPRVAGEIVGGLLLGPSLLGGLLPEWERSFFYASRPTAAFLAALYQLGLFLLMYCAGAAVHPNIRRDELRTTSVVAAVGNAVPFAAGLAFVAVYSPSRLLGPAHNRVAFLLIFACAIAVTSIPVISRIMADLGILGTPFARIVLTVAVFEDFVLYVILSIALGLVGSSSTETTTLPSLLLLRPNSVLGNAYYVAASLAFFALPLVLGRDFLGRLIRLSGNVLHRSNPLAFQLLFVLVLTSLALFVGVSSIFGAFIAGILSGKLPDVASARAQDTIRTFSFATFIPIYFAVVGLRLDLLRHFHLLFFALFLVYACLVKAASVYFGARLAGERPRGAWNLAMALNARGGPAIVLASVAFDAGIIGDEFYVDLVLLALITSVLAGWWLGAKLRSGVSAEDLRPRAAGA